MYHISNTTFFVISEERSIDGLCLLCIHYKVDNWIYSRVSHGKPEEDEENVLGIKMIGNILKIFLIFNFTLI